MGTAGERGCILLGGPRGARVFPRAAIAPNLVLAGLLAHGCGPGFGQDGTPGDDDDSAVPGDDDSTPVADDDSTPSILYDHFCGELRLGGSAQAAWEAAFAAGATPDDTLAPVVVDPQRETRYPGNWPAPTWSWLPGGGGANLYLLEVDVPTEQCPLRVLTTESSWVPDTEAWTWLRLAAPDLPLTLRLSGASADLSTGTVAAGPWQATAPRTLVALSFSAPGRIVYWTTSYNGALISVQLGQTAPVYFWGYDNDGGRCVGCHTGTPDGLFFATQIYQPATGGYGVEVVRISDFAVYPGIHGTVSNFFLYPDTGWPAASPAFWNETDPRLVVYNNGHLKSVGLVSGVLTDVTASGDPQFQAEPSWSPDGHSVAYVSCNSTASSLCYGTADIWTVPYGDGYGGAAAALAGASDPSVYESFPAWSPDGAWIAFNRASDLPHGTAQSEIWLVPSAGGGALRLAANDPPAELGQVSPGVGNSIPKWAPGWQDIGSDRWFFLTFSSSRTYGLPQVWIAPLRVDGAGQVSSYPALYLPGQDPSSGNHIPVWMLSDP